MNEPVTVEIPLGEFDLSLLPQHARETGSETFRDAVVAFFQRELQQAAEWIQVAVDQQVIRVAWRAKADLDPLQLAVGRLKGGDYPRGVQMLRLALRLRPGDAKVRFNLGMALSDLGQLDEALDHLRQAAEAVPDVADVQVALGVALYRKGLVDDARPVLENAVRLEPDNPYALRNLAGCLLRLNQPPGRAVELLRKATALLPEDQQAWIGLGQALEAQGQDGDADKAYVSAIGINPHSQLAEVAKRGRSQIAQKTMRGAVGGGLRPDAVMYCLAALEKCDTMPQAEIQKIAFEIAAVGTKGINPNDPDRKYRLRTLPGEFSGLQLLCYMFVTWKKVAPEADMGFDLSREYEAALGLFKPQQG
jgi:Flp pilus assembly protein TadD